MCKGGELQRWNLDRTACEANDCSAAFPHELNGQWCVSKLYPNPGPRDWFQVDTLCENSRKGVLMPFTNMREYHEAIELHVRWVCCAQRDARV